MAKPAHQSFGTKFKQPIRWMKLKYSSIWTIGATFLGNEQDQETVGPPRAQRLSSQPVLVIFRYLLLVFTPNTL